MCAGDGAAQSSAEDDEFQRMLGETEDVRMRARAGACALTIVRACVSGCAFGRGGGACEYVRARAHICSERRRMNARARSPVRALARLCVLSRAPECA